MSGGRVLGALGLIILATAVIPPLAAVTVNRSRVRLASDQVALIAEALGRARPALHELANRADVLCGAGRMPLARTLDAERWVTAPRAALTSLLGDMPADPWGNCYVVNLAAPTSSEPAALTSSDRAVLWVLSAGPNGIIETPFVGVSETPGGDDVALRIR
jgi:hypothetical protein